MRKIDFGVKQKKRKKKNCDWAGVRGIEEKWRDGQRN